MAWKRLIFIFLFFSSVVEAQEIKLRKIISFDEPWGSSFVNDDELLITEKSGKIKKCRNVSNLFKKKNEMFNSPNSVTL